MRYEFQKDHIYDTLKDRYHYFDLPKSYNYDCISLYSPSECNEIGLHYEAQCIDLFISDVRSEVESVVDSLEDNQEIDIDKIVTELSFSGEQKISNMWGCVNTEDLPLCNEKIILNLVRDIEPDSKVFMNVNTLYVQIPYHTAYNVIFPEISDALESICENYVIFTE